MNDGFLEPPQPLQPMERERETRIQQAGGGGGDGGWMGWTGRRGGGSCFHDLLSLPSNLRERKGERDWRQFGLLCRRVLNVCQFSCRKREKEKVMVKEICTTMYYSSSMYYTTYSTTELQ